MARVTTISDQPFLDGDDRGLVAAELCGELVSKRTRSRQAGHVSGRASSDSARPHAGASLLGHESSQPRPGSCSITGRGDDGVDVVTEISKERLPPAVPAAQGEPDLAAGFGVEVCRSAEDDDPPRSRSEPARVVVGRRGQQVPHAVELHLALQLALGTQPKKVQGDDLRGRAHLTLLLGRDRLVHHGPDRSEPLTSARTGTT